MESKNKTGVEFIISGISEKNILGKIVLLSYEEKGVQIQEDRILCCSSKNVELFESIVFFTLFQEKDVRNILEAFGQIESFDPSIKKYHITC